ncbi:MAG: heavy metal translocating P-type ATPase metal-binding domain-containing protein [Bacteroidetes bacterium]|nr:heavy metal translocating P-type ATPase metal-binding domain-containing protein [Bacteroidota bacterium]
MSIAQIKAEKSSASPSAPKMENCFHCGADVGRSPINDGEKSFCCSGCYTVYGLLSSHHLADYYQLQSHPGQRPEGNEGKYAWLADPVQASKLLEYQDAKVAKATLKLPTMHCAACIWLLEQLYKIQPGILRSEVDFPRREVSLSYDPNQVTLEKVATLLDALGYPPALSLADAEEGKSGKKDRSGRVLWYELGVAGFCFGNIMLLSFPEYLSLDDPTLSNLFRWLSMGLSIPVVTFSARSYFKSAWSGLKHRMINMDVPIAIGIVMLFVRSSLDVILNTGSGYFDSLAGLLFFLLIGKAYQRQTYHMLSFERDYRSYFPISVNKLMGTKDVMVPVSELKQGDQITIRNGELIPADGFLLHGEGEIDYSFVTGESEPVPVRSGERIYAGGRQTAGPIKLVLEREVSQGYLTKLWNHEAFRKKRTAEITQQSDRIGQRFTPVVLVIAAVAAIFWAIVDSSMIWTVVSSVLIVACPCALALSTPFTLGHVLRVFGRRGFYLKGPAVVESLAEAEAMIFDKTGTLTSVGEAVVSYAGKTLTTVEQNMVRSVLAGSIHPLSRRLYAHFPEDQLLEVEDFEEEKGKGISGTAMGTEIRVGSASFLQISDERNGGVFVEIGGDLKGRFELSNDLRPGISEVLKELGAGMRLGLLSGDHPGAEAQMRGIMPDGATLMFRQDPAAKLEFIRSMQAEGQKVAMVGDGLNDAGALKQADVGIAITDDLAAFTPASDAILAAKSIHNLPAFLEVAKGALKLVKYSFLVSFSYNAVGIAFAVSGHLSPLVAAILMPLSSVSVVLFTTAGVSLLARKKLTSNK